MRLLAILSLCCAFATLCRAQSSPPILSCSANVMNYGATGNGNTIDTPAINNAIIAVSGSATASGSGPGLVYFPSGSYLCGGGGPTGYESVQLKSNCILYLAPGAIIKGNTGGYDIREYYPNDNPWASYQDFGHDYFHDALIWGENLNNIGIEGPGEITGNGHLSTSVNNDSGYTQGLADKILSLVLCTNITLTDGTMTSSGHFGILMQGCANLYMNNYHMMCANSRDSFDLIQSSHCLITNSVIQGSDDAMCMKSDYALGYAMNCSDLRVDHCWILSTENNAIQFGSETVGNFTDMMFTNCLLTGGGKAGIGMTSNDGTILDGLTFCGITETNCAAPIYLKLSDQGRAPGPPPVGRIRNISVTDVRSAHAAYFNYAHACAIFGYPSTSGSPSIPITNVVIDNVTVTSTGGAPTSQASDYPSETNNWVPQALDPYPAYGWFLRHVNGIAFIGSSGTLPGWTPAFPALSGSYPGISGTFPGWVGPIPDYTSTNCQAHEDTPDGRGAIKNDADGKNIKFDNFIADVNASGTNNSPYDVGFYSVTGTQMTNCSGTVPLFEHPGMSGTMALRITSSSSTGANICFPPTFSPLTGSYSTAQSITLSCQTPGVTIRYTTDDSEPSESNGTIYTGPFAVTNYAAVRAIAYESGMTDSAVNTSIYYITSVAPVPAFTMASGSSLTSGTYYGSQTLNITSLVTLTSTGSIRYTLDGSTPTETHGTLYTGPITLTSSGTVSAIAYASGLTDSPVASQPFEIFATAAAPTFSPPGGSYSGGESVAISSTTSGASINYTVNGTTPTETNGTLYTGPIAINSNTTLQAIAFANGISDSAVSSTTYTIAASGTSYEAVDLTATTSAGDSVSPQTDTTIGSWQELVATGTGQWVQYTISGLAAGTYDFQMEWKGNTGRGILDLSLDGTILSGSSQEFDTGNTVYTSSTTLNQYTPGQTYWITDYGHVTVTGTGNHLIRQTVVGTTSSGYDLSAAVFYFNNLPPSISSIADQNLYEDSNTGAISFTVVPGFGPATGMVVTATTSNPSLVPLSSVVLTGSSINRTVTVTPAAASSGASTVTLTVTKNSLIANSTFNVTVTPSAAQSWRLQYFGTAADSGNAADTADPAGDGLSNLEKYLLGLNPTIPQVATFGASVVGSNFVFTYNRSDAAAAYLTVTPQWAASPDGPWSTSNITEQILSDNGTTQTVQDSVPTNGATALFFELQITDPSP